MVLPASDRLLEDVFDLVNKQQDEPARVECARIALLAAQHRAQQLKEQRTRRAIERVAEERRALKALTGASRDTQQRAADVLEG